MLDVENLAPVFDDRDIHFVTEDPALLEWLDGQGLAGRAVADLPDAPPANAVLALVTWDGELPAVLLRRVGEVLADSRVLALPIGAFDPSLRAATYTIERLLRSDIVAACGRGAAWADEIRGLGLDESLRFTGPGTDLRVTLGRRVSTGARLEPRLNPGERVSAISFFELEFESVDTGKAEFSVDGTLNATGMIAARSSTMPAELFPKWHRAEELVRTALAGGDPDVTVAIEGNHFRSVVIDGQEMLPELVDLTNAVFEAKVVEFSIGTNESMRGQADWSHNSLMNEGHAGIHVAMGDGRTGPHVDFVCTDVEYARSS